MDRITLQRAKLLYDDAQELNIALEENQPLSSLLLRRLIAPDLCVIHYELHDNLVKVIVSQKAKEDDFPDCCQLYDMVPLSEDSWAAIGYSNQYIQITFESSLHKHNQLLQYVQNKFADHLERITFFDDADMAVVHVKGMTFEDVNRILIGYTLHSFGLLKAR